MTIEAKETVEGLAPIPGGATSPRAARILATKVGIAVESGSASQGCAGADSG